ncbi:hypothetical protein ACFQJ7_05975 [Halovenus rubra]|uniref:GIY-YIG domain-containing protein n=2 Tax=Halovenus rubra TaxID=869890 RepID=A0ABD5X6Z5_9EURY|nr:hypothetical protein [Halovenus rubra]
MGRKEDIERLYNLLELLEERVNGKRKLKNCDGYLNWPDQGIYFFFSNTEREETTQQRITRTGKSGDLWDRLYQHRGPLTGNYPGGGRHRASRFRLHIGEALIERDGLHSDFPEWGAGDSAVPETRDEEQLLEEQVSNYIRELPFLWINVNTAESRNYLERNLIALLSNFEKEAIDPRSSTWLGKYSPNEKIRKSGLWCVNDVHKKYDSDFLDELESHILKTTPVE